MQASTPPPPPPSPDQLRDIKEASRTIHLAPMSQPKITAMPLDAKSMAGLDYAPDGRVLPMSRSRDGRWFPTPQFEAQVAVNALSRDYPPAHAKAATKDGVPYEQSMLLTMYGLIHPKWSSDQIHEDWHKDPDLAKAMRHEFLDDIRFRFAKTTPKTLATAGVIRYPQQVVGHSIFLDVDLADLFPKTDPRFIKHYQHRDPAVVEKLPWNQELWEQFGDVLESARSEVDWLDKCACFYTTQNGFRLVYLLSHPIPVMGPNGLEDKLRGAMMALAVAGIATDTGCCDWTRLMRAYRCYKGSHRIGHGGYYRLTWNNIRLGEDECEERPETLLAVDPDLIPSYSHGFNIHDFLDHRHFSLIQKVILGQEQVDKSGRVLEEPDIDLGSMPSPQEANQLIYADGAKETQLFQNLRRRLKDLGNRNAATSKAGFVVQVAQRLYNLIFEQADILEEFAKIRGRSGLHYGNFYAVWDLCSILRDDLAVFAGNYSPQFVYAVLVQSYIQAMERRATAGDASARSEDVVRNETWRAVVANYPVQFAIRQQVDEEQKEEEFREERSKLQDEWDKDMAREHWIRHFADMTGMSLEEAKAEACKFLIVESPLGRCVARYKDGRWSYSEPVTNHAALISMIRDSGHPLINYHKIKNEEVQIRKEDEIMNDFGTSCGKVMTASRLVPGNKVDFILEDGVRKPRFVNKLPGVAESMPATYHPNIDKYLRMLGGEHPEKFMDWLAKFPDIEHPLPALYLHGAPGIGKGMLTEGLRLLTSRGIAANFGDALTGFQDFFYDTFFLIVDEDTAGGNDFEKNVVGVLRRMIGGQLRQINLKGIKGIHIDGEWRLLITANNKDVFQIQQDLTQEDINALNGRIFYIDATKNTDQILEYLRSVGGRFGKNGRGPGTVPDQWPLKIAQHVMWLHENRQVVQGERFLIDAPPSPWHEHLRITSAGGMLICRILAEALREVGQGKEYDWLILKRRSRKVYIRPDLFEVFVERNYQKFRGQAVRTLERLSHGQKRVSVMTTFRREVMEQKPRCYVLNIGAVMNALHNRGYDVDFRGVFGEEMWRVVAPHDIQRELDEEVPVEEGQKDAPSPGMPQSFQGNAGKIIDFPGVLHGQA